MKVKLEGKWIYLKHRLELEGDEVVKAEEDIILSDVFSSSTIGGSFVFPDVLLETCGFEMSKESVDLVIFRWFSKDWFPQTIVSLPLIGLMNENLGPLVQVGSVASFSHNEKLSELFENTILTSTLKEMGLVGFVSISLDSFGKVVSLQAGTPHEEFLSVLEGTKGRIVDFLTGKEPVFLESWTASLALSRSPWPHDLKGDRGFIEGITKDSDKHLWLGDVVRYRKSIYSDSTFLGYSTAWAVTPGEACRRALRTLRNLKVDGKQYRTDMGPTILERMHVLCDRGIM